MRERARWRSSLASPHRSPPQRVAAAAGRCWRSVVPVTLLVLLPAGASACDRYVVTGPDHGPRPGAGARSCWSARCRVSDLRVGDVVTFRGPTPTAPRTVTRRVVALDDGQVTTRDRRRTGRADPWTLRPALRDRAPGRGSPCRGSATATSWPGAWGPGAAGRCSLGAALLTLAIAPVAAAAGAVARAIAHAGS